jgi:hypothetical protein
MLAQAEADEGRGTDRHSNVDAHVGVETGSVMRKGLATEAGTGRRRR